MFTPECMEDGTYKPIQCYEKPGIGKWCWCVDENGLEVIGSKVENSGDAGNLTAEKCDEFRQQNSSEKYWTAFYRHSTASPVSSGTVEAAAQQQVTTTPKPIFEMHKPGKASVILVLIQYFE